MAIQFASKPLSSSMSLHLQTDKEIFAAKLSEIAAETVRLNMLGASVSLSVGQSTIDFFISVPVRSLPVSLVRSSGKRYLPHLHTQFQNFVPSYDFYRSYLFISDNDYGSEFVIDHSLLDVWLSKLNEVSDNLECFITKDVSSPKELDLVHQAGA